MPPSLPLVLAITGASGAVYAVRLLEVLIAAGRDVHLTMSHAGKIVLKQELGITVDLDNFQLNSLLPQIPSEGEGANLDRIRKRAEVAAEESSPTEHQAPGVVSYHHHHDFMSAIASGSSLTAGMVICPCSGGTLSAVVTGASSNLIHRAADVHLKERRPLILVPRETPLSLIQLDNLRRACEAGAIVLPASPGWYHGVRTTRDLVDFIVARILDQLGIPHQLLKRWGSDVDTE